MGAKSPGQLPSTVGVGTDGPLAQLKGGATGQVLANGLRAWPRCHRASPREP